MEFKVTSTMCNDFILKTMEFRTATTDLYDFTYGMLVGMFERVVDDHAVDETDINQMKDVRSKNIAAGHFPRFSQNHKLRRRHNKKKHH